jgi:hypothetical protein
MHPWFDDAELREIATLTPGKRKWQIALCLVYVKRRWLARTLFWVIASVTGGALVWTIFMAVVEPWNHSLYLWPTLTGTWTGEFEGLRGRLLLHLDISGDSENPPIDGSALTCDERGVLRTFSISGGPHGWRGTTFWLTTSRSEEVDDEWVQIRRLEGDWTRNTMHAVATLEGFKRAGGSLVSEGDLTRHQPVVRFTLERGHTADYLAECRSRRGSRYPRASTVPAPVSNKPRDQVRRENHRIS